MSLYLPIPPTGKPITPHYRARFIDDSDLIDEDQNSITPLLSLVADAVEEWEEHHIEIGEIKIEI